MKRSEYTEETIIGILKERQGGMKVNVYPTPGSHLPG